LTILDSLTLDCPRTLGGGHGITQSSIGAFSRSWKRASFLQEGCCVEQPVDRAINAIIERCANCHDCLKRGGQALAPQDTLRRMEVERTKPTLDSSIQYYGPRCGLGRLKSERTKPTLDSSVQYYALRCWERRMDNARTKPTLDDHVRYSTSRCLLRRVKNRPGSTRREPG
jgi:hypothetical protein